MRQTLGLSLLISCLAAGGDAGPAPVARAQDRKSTPLGQAARILQEFAGAPLAAEAAKAGSAVGLLRYVRLDIALAEATAATVDFAWGEFFRNTDGRQGNFAAIDAIGGAPLRNCVVQRWTAVSPSVFGPRAQPLDAGRWLTLSGPAGERRVDRRTPGLYDDNVIGAVVPPGEVVRPLFLEPGLHIVTNGEGGPGVGPFEARLLLPAAPKPFTWTNMPAIATVPRDQDLIVTWSGGDSGTEYVVVGGLSAILEADEERATGAYFACTALMPAGRLSVPASALANLPATPAAPAFSLSALIVGRTPRLTGPNFRAPGLDAGFFTYSIGTAKVVRYE